MANQPHHHLTIDQQLGPLHLKADIPFTAHWTVIFGPSGSGKSSLLRAICGLLPPTGITLHRTTEVLLTKPNHRALGFAPQQSTLFPHLNIFENVAFAPRSKHAPTTAVDEALHLFELTTFAKRMPRELSGGERQRVNLARAFAVPNPKLLLLDEPFSGVDRALRDSLLPHLQSWARDRSIPVISVTHDVDEALLLRAEVVRLSRGSVVAQGPATGVLRDERDRLLQILR